MLISIYSNGLFVTSISVSVFLATVGTRSVCLLPGLGLCGVLQTPAVSQGNYDYDPNHPLHAGIGAAVFGGS